MNQLPVFLNLRGMSVLLVGAGPAADAKRRLIEAAGGVIVDAAAESRIAFVALDDAGEAAAAAQALRRLNLLVNVVDRPALCDFTVPAIVDRAPVIVAIGTGGASAILAKALRERLEALLPSTLGTLAEALFAARQRITQRHPAAAARRRFLDRLLAPGGRLDPFAGNSVPEAAIADALDDADPVADAVADIVVSSTDPDDMTLNQLRLLSRADTVIAGPGVPAAILARTRRDALRLYDVAAKPGPGMTVRIWWDQ